MEAYAIRYTSTPHTHTRCRDLSLNGSTYFHHSTVTFRLLGGKRHSIGSHMFSQRQRHILLWSFWFWFGLKTVGSQFGDTFDVCEKVLLVFCLNVSFHPPFVWQRFFFCFCFGLDRSLWGHSCRYHQTHHHVWPAFIQQLEFFVFLVQKTIPKRFTYLVAWSGPDVFYCVLSTIKNEFYFKTFFYVIEFW